MSPYEGLTLPELLALIHEAAPPDPPLWVPQTVAWAIVLSWLVVLVGLFAWRSVSRFHRNRYRRVALRTLTALEQDSAENPSVAAAQITGLVKRTAMKAFPDKNVSALTGARWSAFLSSTCPHTRFDARSANRLADAAYQLQVNPSDLIGPARRWIRYHHA